jgi:hypothetical protein
MSTFEKVTICIVSNNSATEFNRFAWMIEHNTTYPCKYHVLDNASTCEKAITIGQTLWLNSKGVYDQVATPIKLGEAYNRLLETIDTEYCAFIPINNILSYGWIQHSMHQTKAIDSAGVSSIKSQNDNLYLSGLLSDEKIRLCYLQKDNNVGGMLFGKTELLKDVGGFDANNDIDGYEIEEISHRIMLKGYLNFYVQNAKRVELPIENSILFPQKTEQTIYNYRNKLKDNFKKTNDGKRESASYGVQD